MKVLGSWDIVKKGNNEPMKVINLSQAQKDSFKRIKKKTRSLAI